MVGELQYVSRTRVEALSQLQQCSGDAETAAGTPVPLHCEKDVSCSIFRVVWVRIPGTTSKIQL